MFADDTKLYNRVKKDSTEGSDAIQDDLNQLKDWSDTWLLRFNASKCKCMHLGNDNPEKSYVLGEDEIMHMSVQCTCGVCVQAWSPYQVNDIKEIEKIQRRATKLVPSLREKPYQERLQELHLYPLEVRRLRGDLIEVFKILNGLEDIKPEELYRHQGTQLQTLQETAPQRPKLEEVFLLPESD
ncbi:uncharacterized protein [Amphiura filiformis]|uniref:uncharacterized protein n=1 Tax=Amphiura filiformis TaxID=82378 RepID=UPI003B21A643